MTIASFVLSVNNVSLYIYISCRKFNAEFNKLIKTIGHCDKKIFSKK